jgi:uncharacterized membrane protein
VPDSSNDALAADIRQPRNAPSRLILNCIPSLSPVRHHKDWRFFVLRCELLRDHRTLIIILQLLGFLAAVLLATYAWRLRSVDRVVAVTGLVMAVCGLVPGFITLVIAVVADPDEPVPAGTWNMLEPRGDDILFLGIVMFPAAVALRLGRRLPALGLLALFVVICCLTRLVLEIAGKSRGALDAVGPLSFLVLIAVMAVLSFRGILGADSASQREPDDAYDRVDDRER